MDEWVIFVVLNLCARTACIVDTTYSSKNLAALSPHWKFMKCVIGSFKLLNGMSKVGSQLPNYFFFFFQRQSYLAQINWKIANFKHIIIFHLSHQDLVTRYSSERDSDTSSSSIFWRG